MNIFIIAVPLCFKNSPLEWLKRPGVADTVMVSIANNDEDDTVMKEMGKTLNERWAIVESREQLIDIKNKKMMIRVVVVTKKKETDC